MTDLVNHPAHYEEQSIRLEPIDFCERLPFCEGNALKYCFRAGHKAGSSELTDLKKAQWYLNRWNSSRKNLVLLEKESRGFKDLLVYLGRAGGVLGKAAQDYIESECTELGSFWSILAEQIAVRIDTLELDKALYDQTIGDEI